ncbi:MAG: glycosyltransferase family 2 protein [Nocardiopsaceae bacterium]|nr:glycosyltransferase family 2 protein [Nocardiopsaceae bacterium]
MNPVVSVVVPTLNRPNELRQALGSIAGQRGIDMSEIEVVVVNDGGQPIENVMCHGRDAGLVIQMVEHPRRLGLPSARNTGVEYARGRYLAFLDDDDVFLPYHLASALTALEPGVDGVAATCVVADQRVDPRLQVAGGEMWDVDFDPLLLEVVNLFPVHAAVLRTVTASSARFDPRLPAIEDWDFWIRLTREHGYRFSRLHEPTVVYHRLHQASMIGAVAEDAAAMARFNTLVRGVWSRWPASTSRSARFRLYSGIMYWQVLGRLAAGDPVNPHYYLCALRALARAWREPHAEQDIIDRLAEAAEGDRDDEQRIA